MPHHFPALRAQLAADIGAVLAEYPKDPARIVFGQPLKPILNVPNAVVRTLVERENEGRSVDENYGFEIEMRLPKYDPEATDRETCLFGAADKLIMRLAPFDSDEVPEADPYYADVGHGREVTAVTPGYDDPASPFCSIKLGFRVGTTIYQ